MHATVPMSETLPPIQFKFAASTGEIVGYAATFDGVDLGGDTIARGAFAKTLASLKKAGNPVPLLWAHDHATPIGSWLDLAEDAKGLRGRARINPDVPKGAEALALIRAGDLNGLSIGYRVPPGGLVYGKDGRRTLNQIELLEISVVAVPMDPRARVTSVKGLTSSRDFREFLITHGLPRRAAAKLAAGGWPALHPDDTNEPDTKAADLAAALNAAAAAFNRKG